MPRMLSLYTEDIDKQVEAEELFEDLIESAFLAGIINRQDLPADILP